MDITQAIFKAYELLDVKWATWIIALLTTVLIASWFVTSSDSAESEEVTNQEAIKTVVRSAIIQVAHFTSNNSYALNIACVMSILTASTSPPGPSS